MDRERLGSSRAARLPSDPAMDAPRPFPPVKTLTIGLGLLLAGLGLSRALTSVVFHAAPPLLTSELTSGERRVRQCLQALDEIVTAPGSTVVFGSSMVQMGFSPEEFDAQARALGQELTSYNLGFGGANPEVQLELAQWVAQAYRRQGRRAKQMVIEFTPFQATLARSRAQGLAQIARAKKAVLLTPASLLSATLRSPTEAAHLVGLWTQGAVTPQMTLHALSAVALPRNPERRTDPRRELVERIRQGRIARDGKLPDPWDRSQRGDAAWVVDETLPAYDAWLQLRHSAETLSEDLEWRVESSDLLELRFDPERIHQFIALAKLLSSVAERSHVLLMPTHPDWVKRTPEGQTRLDQVLVRIRAETGLEIIDLSSSPGPFALADFVDTTHLNERSGRPKLSRELATRIVRP
jgi:hypothetical protein